MYDVMKVFRDVKCKIECLELREKQRLEIKIWELSAKIDFQSYEIGWDYLRLNVNMKEKGSEG